MMAMMDSFPEAWSDSDGSELDEFLSKPWPDENRNSFLTSEEGWPGFEPKWRHFSSNQTSKIVSISAVPFDEEDNRNDTYCHTDWNDARDDDDDESVLTLSSMAGATADLATSARQTTPTKPEPPHLVLRQKIPMLLCKSERLKQASPGDKRVRFANCSNEDNIPLDPIIEIGVDTLTEREKPPVVVKAPVVLGPPRTHQTRRTARPPVLQKQKKNKDLWFQDAPLEAYSGKVAPSTWIHNANLFEDKTLPSNTLDFFCRDSALGVPFAQEVSYSEEDTTVTSSESSASGISSLRSGVLDDKLAQVFSLSSIDEERRDPPARHVPAREIYTPTRFDPVPEYTANVTSRGDVEMTAPSEVMSSRDATRTPYYNHHANTKFSHIAPSGSKVADRQKWLNAAFQRPKHELDGMPGGAVPVTKNVRGTIEKFGGRASRVNAVKQKKEELERKLAEKNKGPPTIKTKWEGRPGSYKKKIVLSSYH
jgi:hypothetical protein